MLGSVIKYIKTETAFICFIFSFISLSATPRQDFFSYYCSLSLDKLVYCSFMMQ